MISPFRVGDRIRLKSEYPVPTVLHGALGHLVERDGSLWYVRLDRRETMAIQPANERRYWAWEHELELVVDSGQEA